VRQLPSGTVVAVGDAGYLAFSTSYSLVDIIGLKTPAAGAVHRLITAPSGGRGLGLALESILVSHQARAFVVWEGWDKGVGFVARLHARGWKTEELRHIHPHPLGRYRVIRLQPPKE